MILYHIYEAHSIAKDLLAFFFSLCCMLYGRAFPELNDCIAYIAYTLLSSARMEEIILFIVSIRLNTLDIIIRFIWNFIASWYCTVVSIVDCE